MLFIMSSRKDIFSVGFGRICLCNVTPQTCQELSEENVYVVHHVRLFLTCQIRAVWAVSELVPQA